MGLLGLAWVPWAQETLQALVQALAQAPVPCMAKPLSWENSPHLLCISKCTWEHAEGLF